MTISRPAASLLLSGSGAPAASGPLTAAQAGVTRLVVDLGVDEAHDRVEVHLWAGSALAEAEPGATLTVGLGERDRTVDVLAVDVVGTDVTHRGAVLVGYAPSRRLSAAYVGRSYRDRTVGEVVRDLLDEGGVDAGDVEATVTLPVAHVDPRRSVWGNVHALARLSGCQVTSAADGAVGFGPIPGSAASGVAGVAAGAASRLGLAPSADLREGAELLSFRAGPRTAVTPRRVVSPVASRPDLLLAEPDSGSGAPVLVGLLARTPESAQAATDALEAAARRRRSAAEAVVPGRPELRAGGTATVRGESYRVLRARHVLDAGTGYTTRLLLEGAT